MDKSSAARKVVEKVLLCSVEEKEAWMAVMMVAIWAAAKEEKPLAASWAELSDNCGDVAAAAGWADMREFEGRAGTTARWMVVSQQAAWWASKKVEEKAARMAAYWAGNSWAAALVAS